VWQDFFAVSDLEAPSVHLAAWPTVHTDAINTDLMRHMNVVRTLVELGRAARAESKVKTRQPLGRALVGAADWDELDAELKEQVAAELNVQEVLSLHTMGADLVELSLKANFRALGKRYGQNTQVVAQAVSSADAATLARDLREKGTAHITVDGIGEVELSLEDVVITESPRQGWAVASEAGASVALDLTLTEELKALGLAREVIRLIQDARKSSGLAIGDRIRVHWSADSELEKALRLHGDLIASEVLATEWAASQVALEHAVNESELGLELWFEVV
jgi:isoleucyl-tRNA synthetase